MGTLFFHADYLGSSLVVADDAGIVVGQTVYRPYGEVTGFTGQRVAENSGLYDFGARWYDPVLGRFLQPDPVVPKQLPQALNPFAYVMNQATLLMDPLGLQARPPPSGVEIIDATNNFTPALPSTSAATSGFQFSASPPDLFGHALLASVSVGPIANLALPPVPTFGNPQPSQQAVSLIQQFESFRANVYLDQAGRPTIGFGHLIQPGESFPNAITRSQADALLLADLLRVVSPSLAHVTIGLSQNQVDALAVFAFNIGETQFRTSTALRLVNSGQFAAVPAAMNLFNKVTIGGVMQVSNGLVRRRAAEGALFLTP